MGGRGGAGSRIYKPGYNHAFQTKILVAGRVGWDFSEIELPVLPNVLTLS